MKIIEIKKNETQKFKDNIIALGNFDGIHIAHRKLLELSKKRAEEFTISSAVLIFKEHTLKSKTNDFKVLTSLSDKLKTLEELGIDIAFLCDFKDIKNLTPEEFIENFLIKKLNSKGICVGYDYKFGKDAIGDVKLLKELAEKNKLGCYIFKEMDIDGAPISSSKIREYIKNGELQKAEEMLGSKYFIKGKVISGKHLGSKLGFPTANIELLENYVLPPDGVYEMELIIEGKTYKSAASLGTNYTLNEKKKTLEPSIIDFNRNIYGEVVMLRFVKKIREMTKFENLEELRKQVLKDIEKVKNKEV